MSASSAWLAVLDPRDSASLLLFFLYSIPCELLVSLAPHEPAVLYVARFHNAVTVALVAGAGTLVAELLNYRLMEYVGSPKTLNRLRARRHVQRLTSVFARAPFAALWIAGFVPFIPFLPVRMLAVFHGYPRGRFLAAAVSSRTARFYVVALAGAAVQLPTSVIGLMFAGLAIGVTLPGIREALRQRRWRAECASSR